MFNWELAIKERDEWYDIYSTHPQAETFVEYLNKLMFKYTTASSVVIILEAYKLFDTLSEVEQFDILLMGW